MRHSSCAAPTRVPTGPRRPRRRVPAITSRISLFADGSRGWAATSRLGYESGTVYATTDGGASWSVLGWQGFDAIACAPSGDLVACCDDTHLMADPAGCPYASVDPSSSALGTVTIYGMSFADQEQGWAVAGGATVYRTTNAGARWDSSTIPFGHQELLKTSTTRGHHPVGRGRCRHDEVQEHRQWRDVVHHRLDHRSGLERHHLRRCRHQLGRSGAAVCSSQPTAVRAGIRCTLTGATRGTAWTVRARASCASWAATMSPVAACVVRSTDGGSSWQQVLAPETGDDLTGVSFQDAVHGWAWGSQADLYATTDGGATWTPRDLSNLFVHSELSAASIYGVAFTSASTGIASGYVSRNPYSDGGDFILTTTDGGTTWAESSPGNGATPLLSAVASSGDRVWLAGDGADAPTSPTSIPTPRRPSRPRCTTVSGPTRTSTWTSRRPTRASGWPTPASSATCCPGSTAARSPCRLRRTTQATAPAQGGVPVGRQARPRRDAADAARQDRHGAARRTRRARRPRPDGDQWVRRPQPDLPLSRARLGLGPAAAGHHEHERRGGLGQRHLHPRRHHPEGLRRTIPGRRSRWAASASR